MFWGGDKLATELIDLISDYDANRIDGAAFRLSIGSEIFVSPTGEPHDPRDKPKTQLADKQGFTIPAGQFGFLLTEESVSVPDTALAFISIRASYKFRGLVNVSGFHVDPGYKGRLVFSVFNAGPGPVHLTCGEECFLIFYATLDGSRKVPQKLGFNEIPSKLISPIAGGIESFASLRSTINENDKNISDRIHKIERDHTAIKLSIGIVITVLIAFVVVPFLKSLIGTPPPTAASDLSSSSSTAAGITPE